MIQALGWQKPPIRQLVCFIVCVHLLYSRIWRCEIYFGLTSVISNVSVHNLAQFNAATMQANAIPRSCFATFRGETRLQLCTLYKCFEKFVKGNERPTLYTFKNYGASFFKNPGASLSQCWEEAYQPSFFSWLWWRRAIVKIYHTLTDQFFPAQQLLLWIIWPGYLII